MQDGVLPANNLQDSPGMAWNDSISAYSSTDSSATLSDSYVLVPANILHSMVAGSSSGNAHILSPGQNSLAAPALTADDTSEAVVDNMHSNSLTIDLSLSTAGLHIELSS